MKCNVSFLLSLGERYLSICDVSSPRFCSEELLRYVLKKQSRLDLYIQDIVHEREADLINFFFTLLRKRGGGYPLQYLTHEVGFLDSTLRVHEGVFIPRPETELLVLATLGQLQKKNVHYVLDIGTGTGNIAISIAHYLTEVEVIAVDISEDALALARENAIHNGVHERIIFQKSDCFSNIARERKFDLIISNPPYIAVNEFYSVDKEVYAEPMTALSDGYDGLTMYRKIAREAGAFLLREGLLAFEIGSHQADAVRLILTENGFVDIEVCKDYAGLDRVILGIQNVI